MHVVRAQHTTLQNSLPLLLTPAQVLTASTSRACSWQPAGTNKCCCKANGPHSSGGSSSSSYAIQHARRSIVSSASAESSGVLTSTQHPLVTWVLRNGGAVNGVGVANLAGSDGGSGWGLVATQVGLMG